MSIKLRYVFVLALLMLIITISQTNIISADSQFMSKNNMELMTSVALNTGEGLPAICKDKDGKTECDCGDLDCTITSEGCQCWPDSTTKFKNKLIERFDIKPQIDSENKDSKVILKEGKVMKMKPSADIKGSIIGSDVLSAADAFSCQSSDGKKKCVDCPNGCRAGQNWCKCIN